MELNLVAFDAASTVDTIKSGAIDAVQWLGRQLTLIKDFALSVIAKVVEFAKPAFENLAHFFRELFESAKEWISANREIAVPVGIGGAVAAFGAIASYILFCGKKEEADKTDGK